MQKAALYTSGVIFAISAFVHIARLMTGFSWVVEGVAVPVWVHIPGGLIAAGLAIWMFIAGKRS